MVPSNVSSGGVTDFSDWSNSTGKWGSTQGLYGAIYGYAGPTTASTMSATVDTTNKDLHGIGTVAMGDYGGIGLSYCACSTVTSFSQVQFTVSGLVARLRSADADQDVRCRRPPARIPWAAATASSCYNYPAASQVALPSSTPMTITTPLSSFSNWTSATAAEVVGLQWQWTYSGTNIPADGGVDASAGCPINASITNIKFLPPPPP